VAISAHTIIIYYKKVVLYIILYCKVRGDSRPHKTVQQKMVAIRVHEVNLLVNIIWWRLAPK